MVNIYEDMLIASRTFLKPTEMGTEKDGILPNMISSNKNISERRILL